MRSIVENMIEVTRLNGKKYWINPHMIEFMEKNPDVTLTMLSGKTVVVKESPEDIISKIVAYRQKIGINTQEI
jgi:flagellar protein FlbD